jgi:predicted phosphodiesterase
MRKLVRLILLKPILWAAARFSSKPKRSRIFAALTNLYDSICKEPGKKGLVVPFDIITGKCIIFSDQHKGARNGADDFILAEQNYLTALDYYHQNGYMFVSLGDSEELWENSLGSIKKNQQASFNAEKKFVDSNRFIKIFGNHDLYWDNDPFAAGQLKEIYGQDIKIYEGVILTCIPGGKQLSIFCTHGHQGDASSDGNWFSKFFVSRIWAPLQSYLRINPNTPAYDVNKKTLHNNIMYEWSSGYKNRVLITGHTHQPVFESLTHLERLYKRYQFAKNNPGGEDLSELEKEIRKREREYTAVSIDYLSLLPGYFNSGCCCFSDGDITGIEIERGFIRLIKWEMQDETPVRVILEEKPLTDLVV